MANNLNDITAIRLHCLASVEGVPIIFDNAEPKEQPTGIHCRLGIRPGVSDPASIARRTYEQFGRCYFQVMVPEGTRDNEGWVIAEKFGEAFREANLDGYRIRFKTPDYEASSEEDDWFVITVDIAYTAQH